MDERETVNTRGPYSDLQGNTQESGINFLDFITLPLRIISWSYKIFIKLNFSKCAIKVRAIYLKSSSTGI